MSLKIIWNFKNSHVINLSHTIIMLQKKLNCQSENELVLGFVSHYMKVTEYWAVKTVQELRFFLYYFSLSWSISYYYFLINNVVSPFSNVLIRDDSVRS